MSDSTFFLNDEAFWKALRVWHAGLEKRRGEWAELRRARTPWECFLTSAFHRGFVSAMADAGFAAQARDVAVLKRLVVGIGPLSHAKELGGEHVAGRLAHAPTGSEALRDVRFRRLLAVEDPDDLYAALVRLVRYLDARVDPVSLVLGAYYWNDKTRRGWAERYYTAEKESK